LSSFLHYLKLASIPTLILCLDGEKIRPGRRGKDDNTLPIVRKLAESVTRLLGQGIEFSEEFVTELKGSFSYEKENDFLYI